jgi:hypothetical protein
MPMLFGHYPKYREWKLYSKFKHHQRDNRGPLTAAWRRIIGRQFESRPYPLDFDFKQIYSIPFTAVV